METFDFKEAISYMECGLKVVGPGGRVYTISNGQLICYPLPDTYPKQRRVEFKVNLDLFFYKEWKLYETSSK